MSTSAFFSTLGGGQECCYGDEGVIINVFDSLGGGYSHRYHHGGVTPYGEPQKVCSFSYDYVFRVTFCQTIRRRKEEDYTKRRREQFNHTHPPTHTHTHRQYYFCSEFEIIGKNIANIDPPCKKKLF